MRFQDINWAAHAFQSIVRISAGYRASLNKSNTFVITTFSFQMPHDLFYLLWNLFQLCSSVPGLLTFVNDVSVAELPYNDYFEYFGPDFKLHISPSNMINQNMQAHMEKIKYVQACIRNNRQQTLLNKITLV